jgi:hypothetical protein
MSYFFLTVFPGQTHRKKYEILDSVKETLFNSSQKNSGQINDF